MNTTRKYSLEVRKRAVRMVQEHAGDHASPWAAIRCHRALKGYQEKRP